MHIINDVYYNNTVLIHEVHKIIIYQGRNVHNAGMHHAPKLSHKHDLHIFRIFLWVNVPPLRGEVTEVGMKLLDGINMAQGEYLAHWCAPVEYFRPPHWRIASAICFLPRALAELLVRSRTRARADNSLIYDKLVAAPPTGHVLPLPHMP